jgi:CheY-like chemotaxis protein
VVLLDLGLPKFDGYEAVRQMPSQPWARSSAVTEGVRRLIASGHGQRDSIGFWSSRGPGCLGVR